MYSARLTFYRDLRTVKLEIRPKKIGRKLKKIIDVPEEIDFNELHWEKIRNRYMKGAFAIYDRKENTHGSVYYINSSGIVSHKSLSQRLENLLIEFLETK